MTGAVEAATVEPYVVVLTVEFHADPPLPEDLAQQMLAEVVDAVNEIAYVSGVRVTGRPA